jgi:hypothetical protein
MLALANPGYQRLAAEFIPAANEFYTWLLVEAQQRAQDYAIGWHKRSFSIRLRTNGRPAGFAYGYSPDRFEIYFNYLNLSPAELAELRRALLAYGVFTETGKSTLVAQVSQVNGERLREASRYLLDRLANRDSEAFR